MKPGLVIIFSSLIFLVFSPFVPVRADEIRAAVASNFIHALTSIAREYEQQSPHRIILIPGSTGKHFAQIKNGAPYDVFFAADSHRVEKLEQQGFGIAGTRFTYALGRLVLWSPHMHKLDKDLKRLPQQDFRFLAIANPDLAPYGKAARQVLQSFGVWDQLGKRLVRGENIAQAFQFVESGNASLGFVALSQLQQPGRNAAAEFWTVPQELYDPIRQQALQISPKQSAAEFLAFCKSQRALKIIRSYGYHSPDVDE